MYTKNPWTTPILPSPACAFAPDSFSAVVEAFAKETCTCDEMALAIVGPNGTVPVIFGPVLETLTLNLSCMPSNLHNNDGFYSRICIILNSRIKQFISTDILFLSR